MEREVTVLSSFTDSKFVQLLNTDCPMLATLLISAATIVVTLWNKLVNTKPVLNLYSTIWLPVVLNVYVFAGSTMLPSTFISLITSTDKLLSEYNNCVALSVVVTLYVALTAGNGTYLIILTYSLSIVLTPLFTL